MDLYCQRCDEPWDAYHVQHDMNDELDDFGPNGEKPSFRFKNGEGCPSCDWGKSAPKHQSLRGAAMSAMMDLLGDDIDGAASMMDNFEFAGMLEEEETE